MEFGKGDRVRINIPDEDWIYYMEDIREFQGCAGEIAYMYDRGSCNVVFASGDIVPFHTKHLDIISKSPEDSLWETYSVTVQEIGRFVVEFSDNLGNVDYDFEESNIVENMFNIRLQLEEALSVGDIDRARELGDCLKYFKKTIDKDILKMYSKYYIGNKHLIGTIIWNRYFNSKGDTMRKFRTTFTCEDDALEYGLEYKFRIREGNWEFELDLIEDRPEVGWGYTHVGTDNLFYPEKYIEEIK